MARNLAALCASLENLSEHGLKSHSLVCLVEEIRDRAAYRLWYGHCPLFFFLVYSERKQQHIKNMSFWEEMSVKWVKSWDKKSAEKATIIVNNIIKINSCTGGRWRKGSLRATLLLKCLVYTNANKFERMLLKGFPTKNQTSG